MPALKINVAGTDGIGKTTFASNAPKPIFIKTEEGTNFIRCILPFPMYKHDDDIVKQLQTLDEEKIMITEPWYLIPLIGLRNLCNKRFAKMHSVKGIEALGFGKGYTESAELISADYYKCLMNYKRKRCMSSYFLM